MVGKVSGLTTTLKLCVALIAGVPLSVTTTLNGLVVFACVTRGRQLITPSVEPIVALVGAVGKV